MISVIISVYNVEEYLHICINSVLKQTYQDFEIICIDDASTDSSLEILEYFSKKDSRIKILKNDSNSGLGYSRNKGLDVAQGKYICFLDGDDWFSFDAFEILIKNIEYDNLDVLLFKNSIYLDKPQKFELKKYYDIEFINKFENQVFNHHDLDKTKLFVMANAPWNKFCLKSFLDDNYIRFSNENLIHEDYSFFYKVLTSAKKVGILDKYLYNSRRCPESIMALNKERLFDNIEVTYNIFDVFYEDKELYEHYKKEVLTYIFHSEFWDTYNQIQDEFKEEFFKRIQEAYKVYIKKYGLYKDIKENINKDVLDFFRFEEIVEGILCPIPKISVIIPVYNKQDYISDTLQSIENQTLNNIEVICVDDGSTDNSLNVIKNFNNYSFKLEILKQNNFGAGIARNKGLKIAKGEYISFLDADDLFEDSHALEKMYNHANSSNANMVSANLHAGNTEEIRYRSNYTKFYEEEMVIKPDDYGVPFYFGKNIFKNSFLRENEITFPNLEIGEDPIFLAEILSKINKDIPCIPVDFYYYRISERPGLDKVDTPQKKMDYIKHFKETLTILENSKYCHMFNNYVDLLVEFISHPNFNSDLDVYNTFCREFDEFPEIFNKYIGVFSNNLKNI